jgi:hypothetical protein
MPFDTVTGNNLPDRDSDTELTTTTTPPSVVIDNEDLVDDGTMRSS